MIHIKKFQLRDKISFKLLANCGYATMEQLLTIKNMSEKRIINYVKDGYTIKEKSLVSDIEAYRLTDKGLKFAKKEFGVEHCYVPSSIPHDVMLADFYLSLSSTEQETFKNKTELNFDFYNKLEEYKTTPYKGSICYQDLLRKYKYGDFLRVDCSYVPGDTETGEAIGYVILKTNYSKIDSFKAFCEFMDYKYVQADEIAPTEDNQKIEVEGVIKKVSVKNAPLCTDIYKFNVVDKNSTYKCTMFVHDSTLDKYVKLIKNGNRVKVTGIVRDTEWNLEINVNQIELIP